MADFSIRYKERETMKDKEGNIMHDHNGLTMYCMGDVREKNKMVRLCIEEYRITPDAN